MALKGRYVLRWFEQEVNAAVEGAVREALKQHTKGSLPGEENVTDVIAGEINRQLADGIRRQLDRKQTRGVSVEVKVYHRKTEEPLVGADLGIAVRTTANSSTIEKGVLVQAKLESSTDYKKLREQCETMLGITPDSFVVVYYRSKPKARVYSAHSIRAEGGSHRRAARTCYTESLGGLVRQMIRTFVGDQTVGREIYNAAQLAAPPERLPMLSHAISIAIRELG